MFENIAKFFNKILKTEKKESKSGKEAKERLHLVLMQDRANVSADFLEMMKQEIIEVIKKYIDVDENAIDVRLTNQANGDGTSGAPALYANIPIINIKEERNKDGMVDSNINDATPKSNDNVGADVSVRPEQDENTSESNDNVGADDSVRSEQDENTLESNDNVGVDCIDSNINSDTPESKD